MIIRTSIDNQLPPWTVSAGKVLIVLMIAGLLLTIGRDIYNMHMEWNAYTCRDTCARGSNVPTPTRIPPMTKTKLKLVRHTGVDLEEITLKRKGKMNNIKPCPFCGGKARGIVAEQEDGKKSYSVTCSKCNTAIFRPKILEWDSFQSLEEAIEAWNRRKDDCAAGDRLEDDDPGRDHNGH